MSERDTEPLQTRLFTLTYNNAKIRFASDADRIRSYNVEGVHFRNGKVVLDTGISFDSIGKLEVHFNFAGRYTLKYRDGQVLTNKNTRIYAKNT
jgi:hypothetical protein